MLKINYKGLYKIDTSFHSRVCDSELRAVKLIPMTEYALFKIACHSMIIREKLVFGKWRGMSLATINFLPTIDQNPQG